MLKKTFAFLITLFAPYNGSCEPLIAESTSPEENLVASTEEQTSPSTAASSLEKLTDQFLQAAQQEGAVIFTPPEGWGAVDPQTLPLSEKAKKIIKAMVFGKGLSQFPPSISLAIHPWNGTVKDYLIKEIKPDIETIKGNFKDLGNMKTQAGDARLCQVDFMTNWGELREMHVILKKDDLLLVLTAAALKEEFPRFYSDFFTSMRSLRFHHAIAKTQDQ